ncbi:MAG: dienelactone hydrolase family protein [Flavobacteriales bacterium]|nr:dienelactone hydrolase family protein [Flavobacteriales bacterium]
MEERFILVQRTARYHVLGRIEAAQELWVVLHGYGQLARFFLNNFKGLEDGRCIIAPEGLSRFYLDEQNTRVGATWMTREDRLHEIDDQVSYLDALCDELRRSSLPGVKVNVLGFSQGAATASRWAIRGRTPLKRLVLWAGSIPPELDRDALAAWRSLPVDLVLGDQDEFAAPKDLNAQAQRLQGAGVACNKHLFEGGHRLEPVTLRRVVEGH